jgi:TubC N-terminal docking domain
MNALTLLLILGGNGCQLSRNGDRLHINAPAGFLTPEIHAALRQHKEELFLWIDLAKEAAEAKDDR